MAIKKVKANTRQEKVAKAVYQLIMLSEDEPDPTPWERLDDQTEIDTAMQISSALILLVDNLLPGLRRGS